MITPATYLFKVILLSGVFYGYYWLALRNERFHRWNRYYLLGAVLISLVIPLIHWSSFFASYGAAKSLGIVRLKAFTMTATGSEPGHERWAYWLWTAYGLISAGMLGYLLAGLFRIRRAVRYGKTEKREGYTLVRTTSDKSPFSFFGYVFWGVQPTFEKRESIQILRHEITHVRQYHSVDKLLVEVVIALAWVNPFFYFIRRELHLVHEFLADESSCNKGEVRRYAKLLLSQALQTHPSSLASSFFHKALSRRVRMLLRPGKAKRGVLRQALCIPLTMVVSLFVLLQQGNGENRNGLLISVSKVSSPVHFSLPGGMESSTPFSRGSSLTAGKHSDNPSKKTFLPPPPPPPAPAPPGRSASGDKVFTFVEQMPAFPGGEAALMHYLSAHIHYPASAREDGVQGTVVVQFEVGLDGKLRRITAIGPRKGDALADEAKRVVSEMPAWNPGVQNGHKVVVQYSLPVRFVLQ